MSHHVSRRTFLKAAGAAAAAITAGEIARVTNPGYVYAAPVVQAAKTLTIGINAEPLSLDPHTVSISNVGMRWHGLMFDTLTRIDASGTLKPMLALSWKQDGKTWKFQLRPNVKFHDGSVMTAKDAAYSINRILGLTPDPKPSAARASTAQYIAKAEATGDLELTITSTNPDTALPNRLAQVTAAIMPQAFIEKTGFDALQKMAAAGAGPYKLVSYAPGDRAVFTAHTDYWGGAPAASQVVVRLIAETATRLAALQSGDVDLITLVPPDAIAQLSTDKLRVDSGTVYNFMMIYVNTKQGPTAKVGVRKALSLAVDRQTLADKLWGGRVRVMNDYFLPGEFGYDNKRAAFPFDLAAAKKALAEAGYAGEQVDFTPPHNYYTNDSLITDAIAQMWKDLGINLNYAPMETAAWLKQSLAGKNVTTIGSFSTWGDPATNNVLTSFAPGVWVAQYYQQDEATLRLLAEAASATDPAVRLKNYRAYADILDRDVPIAPLYQSVEFYGVRKDIKWKPNPVFQLDLRPDNFSF